MKDTFSDAMHETMTGMSKLGIVDEITMLKFQSIRKLKGIVQSDSKLTIEEINTAIEKQCVDNREKAALNGY